MELDYPLEEVTSHFLAHTAGVGAGNTCAVNLGDYAVCVDSTMFPKIGAVFRKEVEKTFGVPVNGLLLTHYHGDHVFGNQAFKDLQIIGSKPLYEGMKQQMAERWTADYISEWQANMPPVLLLIRSA